jgi:hypothetical protein
MSDREQQIVRAMIREIREADGLPMDEAVLHFRVERFIAGPGLTLTEVRGAVESMERAGWVTGIVDGLGVRKWAITERGKVTEL